MPVSTMKVAVGALLLLLCGLAVLADHNEVAATKSPIETNQADIHAVLREMSGLLAETRAELRCAKSRLEGMETRLAASEDKAEGLEKTGEELQEKQKEQERAVEAVEARVSTKLKKTVEELEAVEGKMNTTGIQVEELRRAQAAERVSFSASLNISGNIGPLHPTPILVYKHVITNIGNHYNKNTGIFTAPVRGVYYFTTFVFGFGANHPTGVFLHKNGDPIVIAYGLQKAGHVNSSNGASLLLEVGDVVYVKLWHGAWAYDNANHHTTFSGHLLFPM